MNVRKRTFFGKTILVQDEELVLPKLFKIRGMIKEPSWSYKRRWKIYGITLMLIMMISTLAILLDYYNGIKSCIKNECQNGAECIPFTSFYKCKCIHEGYSGKYCENFNACWNDPCEGCIPLSTNSQQYNCTCGIKSEDSTCESKLLGEIKVLAELTNGSMASIDDQNRVKIWQKVALNSTKTLNRSRNFTTMSLASFENDLLAIGTCENTIEIWNLTIPTKKITLQGYNGCVNALQSFKYVNETYLLSGSDDTSIRLWKYIPRNSSFENIITKNEHSGPVLVLVYNPYLELLASSSSDNTIKFWSLSYKLLIKLETEHSDDINSVCVLSSGLIATGSFEIKIWRKVNESTLELVTTLNGHSEDVNALVSLKNNSLVSGSEDKTIKVWNRINETAFICVETLSEQNNFITSLAVFEDKLLISGDRKGKIYIWNQTSFELLQILNVHSTAVATVIVLNDGNLASGSFDKTIRIWQKLNETSFQLKINLTGHTDRINSLVSLSSDLIASASDDTSIRIWDLTTFECIRILNNHRAYVEKLALLENGNLVSASWDKSLIEWNISTFKVVKTVFSNAKFFSISQYLDDTILTTDSDRALKVWKMNNNFGIQIQHSFQVDEILSMTLFQKNYLISGHSDGIINIWKMDQMALFYVLKAHTSGVTCLANINDKLFASGSNDTSIVVWDQNYNIITTLSHNLERINDLLYMNGTSVLISVSNDTSLKIYQNKDIQQIKKIDAHNKSVQDVVILHDSTELIASCSGDKTIKIWNSSHLVATLTGHQDYVYSLEYSPDENILISASKDRSIKLWNLSTFIVIHSFFGHSKSVISLTLIGNTKTFASGSCDYTIKVWQLNNSPSLIQTLRGHSGCVNALTTYLSDSTYLLSGSSDAKILIWDVKNNFNKYGELIGHKGAVNCLTVLNKQVFSGSSDSTIKIWSASYRVSVEKQSDHKGFIRSLCILNSDLIASASDDSTIKIWQKENSSFELISTLSEHKGQIFSLKLLQNNSLVSASADKTIKMWNQINEIEFECVVTLTKQNNSIKSLAIFENKLLLSGDSTGKIFIWNQTTFELLQELKAHSTVVASIIALENGNLVSGSYDKTVKIWQKLIETLFVLSATLTGHTDWVNFLVILSNDLIASASDDTSIRVWNLTTFKCIDILNDHTAIIKVMSVLENGNLISISEDKTAIEWDIHSMSKLKTVKTDSVFTSVVTYTNDTFITADLNLTIKIWSPSFLNNAITLTEHSGSVIALAVFKDGYLVSSSLDKTVRVWDNSFDLIITNLNSDITLALKLMKKGTLIKASSENKTITFWETNNFILNNTIY